MHLIHQVTQHFLYEHASSVCIVLHLIFENLAESLVTLADNFEVLKTEHFQNAIVLGSSICRALGVEQYTDLAKDAALF